MSKWVDEINLKRPGSYSVRTISGAWYTIDILDNPRGVTVVGGGNFSLPKMKSTIESDDGMVHTVQPIHFNHPRFDDTVHTTMVTAIKVEDPV